MRRVLPIGFALAASLHAACVETPAQPIMQATLTVVPKPTPTEVPPAPIAFEQVFPPTWKLGDTWRVAMKTEVQGIPVGGPYTGREYITQEFKYEVIEVPSPTDAEGVYRLDIRTKQDGRMLRYYGSYRAKPFSFMRLEDDDGNSVPSFESANPAAPYLGGDWGGVIKDFPVLPTPATVGTTTFQIAGAPATQQVEPTPTGLRFTFRRYTLQVIIEWNAGESWWSSHERIAFQLPGLEWPPQFPPKADAVNRMTRALFERIGRRPD